MKLMDFLIPDAIEPDMKSTSKEDAIKELTALLGKTGAISAESAVAEVVLEREELGTTAIGEGIAVPHGKSDATDKLLAAFGKSERGVDFDAIDGKPVHLFFLLIAPKESTGPHLMALARISRLLKNRDFRKSLMDANGKAQIVKLFEAEV